MLAIHGAPPTSTSTAYVPTSAPVRLYAVTGGAQALPRPSLACNSFSRPKVASWYAMVGSPPMIARLA